MNATDGNDTQRLAPRQARAADLLAAGRSDSEVADEVGVDRVTVWRWRTRDPLFRAELNQRRAELWQSSLDRARNFLLRALDVIDEALASGDRQAAMTFVKLVGLGGVDLGRVGPTDAELIAATEDRERARREHEQAEAEVRAAEHAADLELRRLLAEPRS